MRELMTLARRDLAQCEEVIERGLATFVEVGQALMEIRDHRLYRLSHDTFENYCQDRWAFNRHRAAQLIGSVDVVTNVTSRGLPPPANEAQARALSPLKADPEKMAEAWTDAIASSNGKPTAQDVAESVARVGALLDADPELQRARWQHNFAKALNHAYDFMAFEPDTVARNIDDDDVRTLDLLEASVSAFCKKVRSLRPRPFDVIQGGQR